MNISLLKSLSAAALLSVATAAASAQELKIGYVNAERVLRDATPAKAAQARLETEFAKREKELADFAARLKAAGEKLDKEALTLPEAERVAASATSPTRSATSSASAPSSRRTWAAARAPNWPRSSRWRTRS